MGKKLISSAINVGIGACKNMLSVLLSLPLRIIGGKTLSMKIISTTTHYGFN